jgi:hypothetical protein
MSSEVIKLANLHNINIGLVKDYYAKGLLTEGRLTFLSKINCFFQYFYGLIIWSLSKLLTGVDGPCINNSFVFDIKSHLNGCPGKLPEFHISKINILAKNSSKVYLEVAEKNLIFVLALGNNGFTLKKSTRFFILSFLSERFGCDQLGNIEELKLGWDDNWRAGALIKTAKERGIKTKVYQHGIVGNSIRYIPYSDKFYYFEKKFTQLVINPLDIELEAFIFNTRNRTLAYCPFGKNVLFLTKIEGYQFNKIPFSKFDVVVFHPLQDIPLHFRDLGIKLENVKILKIRSAETMRSTIENELRASEIPTKVFRL